MVYELLNTMNDAFDAGQRVEATPWGSAIHCPIGHTEIYVRMSWMNGFSKGREHLQALTRT
ncbi:hypothetical protein ACVOMT_22765 (plasmid) [Sphingomonas panni]|jgi:hypothetical protein|uniref:hypothetical protein n=1 Tax=Sphingomonas hankookensis TaxID=563996 RepID=UPI003D3039CE